MKTKYAIASIVLIACMCGYIFPTSVHAFNSGNGVTNNTSWVGYGPNLSTLFINAYAGGYAGEVGGMESSSSDFIDTTLLPSDYSTMSGMKGVFNYSEIVSLGIDEIDWNTYFAPFNNTDYAKAVSEILQIDKANFVQTWLGSPTNGGIAAYSPICGCITVNSNFPWYDPNTANIYAGGYAAALNYLLDSGISLTADLNGPANTATWNFSAPYPMSPTGASYNPFIGTSATSYPSTLYMGPGAGQASNPGDGGLFFIVRVEDVRLNEGKEATQWLGANFTWWYQNVAPTQDPSGVTAFKNALWHAGLDNSTYTPYITCTSEQGSMDEVKHAVWYNYCDEMYTAGYSYSFLPLMLEEYQTYSSPEAFGWVVPGKFAGCYNNTVFDGLESLMENSTNIGTPTTPGTSLYYCYAAQEELMGGTGTSPPAIFPYFDETGYSPIPAADVNGISMPGTGYNNWYTYLDMRVTPASPYYAENAAQVGMRGFALSGANPISSYSIYDFAVWQMIYDTLAISNPYNLSELVPYIATNWSTGSWTNTGNGVWPTPKQDSYMNITMRNDVQWQDVPGPEYRDPYTLDNGTELDAPMQNRYMTPLDVAFSFAYAAIGIDYDFVYTMGTGEYVDHIVISNMYQNTWDAQFGSQGLVWANETYVELSTLGVVAPAADIYPSYQLYTPGQIPYENTSQYENTIVQFSPTLGPDQMQVYLSINWPWLSQYEVLGMPILPFDIFSHISMGSWVTTDIQGKPWTTTDVCYMDMEPQSLSGKGGADIEYGSGPWILVDSPSDVAATTWVLKAFRSGLTYGPGLNTPVTGSSTVITTAGSCVQTYPLATASPTYAGPVVSSTGNWMFYMQKNLVNYDYYYGYDGTYAVNAYLLWVYVSNTGPPYLYSYVWAPVVLQTYSYTIGEAPGFYGSTTVITMPWLAFNFGAAPAIPGSHLIGTWGPWLSATVSITSETISFPPMGPSPFLGTSSSADPGWVANQWPGYAAYTGIAWSNSARLLGDISGGIMAAPYWGAKGSVNSKDFGLIAANWLVAVPSGTSPISNLGRANIVGGTSINSKDVAIIASEWLSSWSITTPPPTTPPPISPP